jgi:nitrile hydratase
LRPRFDAGDKVLVLDLGKPGHVRIPFYIRGHIGTVIHRCGCFLNPEDLAVGSVAGPVVPLYRVGFFMNRLWPDYVGSASDLLYIEIYDHWLAMADSSAVAEPGVKLHEHA